MATVLLLEDERTSSARLLAALQDDGEHQTWTAETLNDGVNSSRIWAPISIY